MPPACRLRRFRSPARAQSEACFANGGFAVSCRASPRAASRSFCGPQTSSVHSADHTRHKFTTGLIRTGLYHDDPAKPTVSAVVKMCRVRPVQQAPGRAVAFLRSPSDATSETSCLLVRHCNCRSNNSLQLYFPHLATAYSTKLSGYNTRTASH